MEGIYMECGGMYTIGNEKHFGRNIYVAPEDVDNVRKRFKNVDVYVTTFMYNNEDQDKSDLYGPLYIDLDYEIHSESDFNRIRRDLLHVVTALNVQYNVPFEMMKIYFSGNKGFHVMVSPEVFGIEPDKKLNEKYKIIAMDLKEYTMFKTVDTRIYDNKRLFRLPNSINAKTGLYKTPVDLSFVRDCTYSDLTTYAQTPQEIEYPEPVFIREAARKFEECIERDKERMKCVYKNSSPFRARKRNMSPCIKSILENGATQGVRNNTAVVLASSLIQNGMDIDDAMETVLNWNSEKVSPRLPDREIRATVKSAFQGIQNGKRYGCRTIKELGLCVPGKCNCKQ